MTATELTWYSPTHYPNSAAGFVYIIRLSTPYIGGVRKVRVGGHYERDAAGVRHLVGGHLEARVQYVEVYVGWSPDPERRLAQHRAGRGANILRYFSEIGLSFDLVGVAPGGRDVEAALKRSHNGRRLLDVLGLR